ncbi:MAG: glutamate racemase [Oscillospiraceae bacterium]
MDKRAIGIFDSGLGGLTTVREMKKILPHEDIIYFGDTGRVPYGTRSNETIKKYAKQDINFLLKHDVKMIIAACNTASAIISEDVVCNIEAQYTGVLAPAVSRAIKTTKNGRIGVIGTQATIKSCAYEKALMALNSDLQIFGVSCPLFVPLVENGFTDKNNEVTHLVAEQYLSKLKELSIDTLILGCTHYPIISTIIKDIMGDKVVLIDSGQEAARYAKEILVEKSMLTSNVDSGKISFFVSDSTDSFSNSACIILGEPLQLGSHLDVKKIDIELY